jgi:hypothetical protein
MVEVVGTTPGETKPRVVEIQRDGNTVSIWLHPPDSEEQSGWQALVSLDELRRALVAEGILKSAVRIGLARNFRDSSALAAFFRPLLRSNRNLPKGFSRDRWTRATFYDGPCPKGAG